MSNTEETPEQRTERLRLLKNLTKRDWRLRNLYKIKDKDGNIITFKPNRAQRHFDENKHSKNIILKSRQLGFSTFECIDSEDEAMFTTNRVVDNIIIGHQEKAIKDMFTNKISFAWNNLRPSVRGLFKLDANSANQLSFGIDSLTDPKHINSISVNTTARSGSPTRLHVTELSYLDEKFPDRASEIITGGIPAIPDGELGRFDIESTSRGESGVFHAMCMTALERERSGKPLTHSDFKLHFYNWMWDDYGLDKITQEHIDAQFEHIPQEFHDYRDQMLVEEGIEMTDRHLLYYYNKFKELRDAGRDDPYKALKQEYPTTIDEAFESSGDRVFNVEVLKSQDIIKPRIDGRWMIFKEYNPDHVYSLGADVAEGVGKDSSAIQIIDITDNCVVAGYESNEIDPTTFAHEVAKGGRMYGECAVAVERNNHGHATLGKLREIYPLKKIYKEEREDKTTKTKTLKYGWLTGGHNKAKIIYGLSAAINNNLRLHSNLLIKELRSYPESQVNQMKANEKKMNNGKGQTNHWDRVIALSIAYAIKDYAFKVKTAKRHSNKALLDAAKKKIEATKRY